MTLDQCAGTMAAHKRATARAWPRAVDWHRQLAATLATFSKTRVVCRFYDTDLIHELYPEPSWAWTRLRGRTQANSIAAEVMLVRNGPENGLFTGGGNG